MRVLLVSTYELGHQPLHVASPAAALRSAGHDVRCLDTSVEPWDDQLVGWAQVVAFSVPMHTAMRLAMRRAEQVKDADPELPVCFYGLYAPVSRDLTVGRLADRILAGEYQHALVAWVDRLDAGGPPTGGPEVLLDRGAASLPARDLLPPLERYAHLRRDDEEQLVGYVEATHGCLLECRHCPVPTVYGGRFRAVDRQLVLDDIAQLVEMGAQHITFGDPDFLNGPTHSLRIVEEMHDRWPDLTFDCTTKVDHILDHADLLPTFAASGCVFVVSAFESRDERVLQRLDKGHTVAQEGAVVELLRGHGIDVRPTWLPFTPWTTPGDVVDILDFVIEHDLIGNVDPVQYTIRLLLPEGSLLLEHPDLRPHLGPYDADRLTYTWEAADPRADDLQRELAALVEARTAEDASPLETFLDLNARTREAADRPARDPIRAGSTEGRPRLTEPWFC